MTIKEANEWASMTPEERKAKNYPMYLWEKTMWRAIKLVVLVAIAMTVWNVVTRPADDHVRFIERTSDLPSSTQHQLDQIYKADPDRARDLSRQAHEAGVQNLRDAQ